MNSFLICSKEAHKKFKAKKTHLGVFQIFMGILFQQEKQRARDIKEHKQKIQIQAETDSAAFSIFQLRISIFYFFLFSIRISTAIATSAELVNVYKQTNIIPKYI